MTDSRSLPLPHQPLPALELWAGLECTLNRVGDTQNDELALTGHYGRDGDLALLASLGIRTIRYPVLWERIEANVPDGRAWDWTDERMSQLRALGITPIVGLVHHGSGPRHTNLLDPAFPEKLAEFAGQVARRYPWVTNWTPINEPLTTARFSALYGVWYPHERNDALFLRATLNQIRAIRLAMAAIREAIPGAQLVQTEDLGCTHATPALQYQADFENARRWLAFDLLTARFGADHPLRAYTRWARIGDAEIDDAVGDGCAPALVGLNHYVTSERWLDERLDRYPAHTHGGNHRHRYADVEAVRALPGGVTGPRALFHEAWERYRIPVAVTEAHLACTREQQLRWLAEIWRAAQEAREDGADIRGVTAWAAFGTQDWSSLVTRIVGDYEAGLYDVRSSEPRPTALASMARALATKGTYAHPALESPGWWHSEERVTYPADEVTSTYVPTGRRAAPPRAPSSGARPVLVVGARGTLGHAFLRACATRGLVAHGTTRAELDAADRGAVEAALAQAKPWAVINAAGYVRVDDAERDPAGCHRGNVAAAATLAAACAERGLPLLTFSSDLVFDGAKGAAYVERDPPAPLGVYGTSKADAEQRVLAVLPSALVVRTAAFFGPWDEWNFVTRALQSIGRGVPVEAAEDLVVSPTYVPDLVHAALDLLIDGERGIWHLANAGAISWAGLAREAARAAGLDPSFVHGRTAAELGLAAPRPRFAALTSERGRIMPALDHALGRYLHERRQLPRRTHELEPS